MDTARIVNAAKEIDRCERALEWLEKYSQNVTPTGTRVDIRMDYAGSCCGANDAKLILERMVSNRILTLLSEAKESCRNTIELHRQAIREEVKS